MGRRSRQRGRPVNGILLLDKPIGLSSNHALQRVKRLYDARKAGHTGSLDPLADGMLPICLGEATKLAGEVLDGDKVYTFRIALGSRTATGDTEGEESAGNAWDDSLVDLWANLSGYRQLHLDRKFDELPERCDTCTDWKTGASLKLRPGQTVHSDRLRQSR